MLQLNGVTREERLAATWKAREAMAEAGAWITGFHQFSNQSVCLNFEIDSAKLPALYEGLTAAGIVLARVEPGPVQAGGAIAGSLQILFIHGDPDLRIPQPAVPG